MNVKFCITTIDLFKIDEEIKRYVNKNKGVEPYLFISENTMDAIKRETGYDEILDPSLKPSHKGVVATYSGYKVFINNDLNFGVVEIR